MTVVSDTTPMCHLRWINLEWLLPQIFGVVHVPQRVVSELRASGAPPVVRTWMQTPPDWLVVVQDADEKSLGSGSHRLDCGEAQAIDLAVRLHADLILADDRAARLAAHELGIRVVGTLEILEHATNLGLIDFDRAVSDLLSTGFWLSDAVLEGVKQRLREK